MAARPKAGYPVNKDGKISGDKAKEYDEQQARKRELFYAMMDYAEGRDTPGARMVADTLIAIEEKRRESKLAGDPLRLLPEHREVKAREQKIAKKAAEERRKKGEPPLTPVEALRNEAVIDPLNPWMGRQRTKSRGYSRRFLEAHQQNALDKFERDYEIAYGGDLKGAAWDPKVDGGGGATRAHIARLEAQARLSRLQRALNDPERGDADYRLLMAVAIGGVTMSEIQAAGGPRKDVVTRAVKLIAQKVAIFYGNRKNVRDPLIDALDKIEGVIKDAARTVDNTVTASGLSGEESRKRTQR